MTHPSTLTPDAPVSVPIVVIDARMVNKIIHGIARYVISISQGLEILRTNSKLTYEPLFLVNSETSDSPFKAFRTYKLNSPFLSPSEIIEIPKALKSLNAAVYHSPSFSSLWKSPCPSIVTVHDLNHLTFGNVSQKIYYQVLLRRFARRAKSLITVSEFSRQEISRWLRLPLEKIDIVYNGVDRDRLKTLRTPASPILEKHGLTSKNYFFCLSNPKPHKNLPLLISAFQEYERGKSDAWPIVITTDAASSSPGVKAVGKLSELEAATLLQNAGGVFFPSLYEGFGLPPVEAAVLGIPLAVSKIPPHEEGLKDLSPNEVLWVHPTDVKGWADAFRSIQKGEVSPPSEETQKRVGLRFSPIRLGEHMDQIYRRVLGQTTLSPVTSGAAVSGTK